MDLSRRDFIRVSAGPAAPALGGLAGLGADLAPTLAAAAELRIKGTPRPTRASAPTAPVGCATARAHARQDRQHRGRWRRPAQRGTLCPRAPPLPLHVNPTGRRRSCTARPARGVGGVGTSRRAMPGWSSSCRNPATRLHRAAGRAARASHDAGHLLLAAPRSTTSGTTSSRSSCRPRASSRSEPGQDLTLLSSVPGLGHGSDAGAHALSA